MKKLLTVLILFSQFAFAQSGADFFLNQVDVGKDTAKTEYAKTKQLNLDNPFLVQIYGHWKSFKNLPFEVNSWMDLVVKKDYEKASHLISVMEQKAPEQFRFTVNAVAVYLYWQLDLPQTFLNAWVNLAAESEFLTHQLGIALDETIFHEAGEWFFKNRPHYSADQKFKLEKIKDVDTKFNRNAQAWMALRKGSDALAWLKALDAKNPLRFRLAQTVLLDFAKKNQLGDAAKLLKAVFEPRINSDSHIDALADYYILLARLLYQANALDASEHYYNLIPNKANQYLQARVEALWISLRKADMAKLNGELGTLKMELFDDQFLPERYLVGAISHLKLCQFEDVKKSFNRFIDSNKKWARIIEKNIASEDPEIINNQDFFLEATSVALLQGHKEKEKLESLARKSVEATVPAIGVQGHWKNAISFVQSQLVQTEKHRIQELRRGWLNRKKILDNTIRKMRFVKVEAISLMSKMASDLKNTKPSEQGSSYASRQAKSNQLKFPHDGMVWGDELFNMTAEVKNLCLTGNM